MSKIRLKTLTVLSSLLAVLMSLTVPAPVLAVPPRLSHELAPTSRILRFEIAPDDETIVYTVGVPGQPTEIWRTSIQAPVPVKLAETFVDDGDSDPRRPSFRLTVDGSAVVFRSGVAGLSYVMMAGGGATPLTPTMPVGAEVRAYDVLDDGTVIYLADQEVVGQPQLYRVPGDSDTAERVSPSTPSGHYALDYAISSDQAHLVYAFGQPDSISTDPKPLYSVALAGPTFGNTLLGMATPGWFLITGDGQHVIYRAQSEILSVPTNGATGPHVVIPAGSQAQPVLYDVTYDGSAFLFSHWVLAQNTPQQLLFVEDMGSSSTLSDVQPIWNKSALFDDVGAQFAADDRYIVGTSASWRVVERPPSSATPYSGCTGLVRTFDTSTWYFCFTTDEMRVFNLVDGPASTSVALSSVSSYPSYETLRFNGAHTAFFIADNNGLRYGPLPGNARATQLLAANVTGQTRVVAYDLTSDEGTVVYQVEALAANQMDTLYAVSIQPLSSHWIMLPAINHP